MPILAAVIFAAGFVFLAIGTYGMWKNKDFFINITLSSFFDTIGFLCFGVGLIVYLGWQMASLKLLTVLLFFLFLNPLVTHTLARSANLMKAPSKEVSDDN
jgi:multisubunit Na+/H+ antiporter, mnhG subunit